MTDGWTIGIIGGSGLYEIDGLDDPQWIAVDTPWGAPSDDILCGTVGGVRVRFLPRHGRGHPIPPGEINARANIDALKRAGCTDILSLSAAGSLREALTPGHFVVADQFIDRTLMRPSTFFGAGMTVHTSMADPVCPRLGTMGLAAVQEAGGTASLGATYVAVEGPQFSTRAESRMYRTWGADIIGMTALPEARLCREAELPYALIAMITDYDSWREDGAAVEMPEILAQMQTNTGTARRAVEIFLRNLPAARSASPIDTALDAAIVTAPSARDPALLAKLDAVAGRALGRN